MTPPPLAREYAAAAARLGRPLTADERTAVAFRCALEDAEAYGREQTEAATSRGEDGRR